MPSISAWSLALPDPAVAWARMKSLASRESPDWTLSATKVLLMLLGDLAVTVALTVRIVLRFDRWLDRPPLSSSAEPPARPARILEEVTIPL